MNYKHGILVLIISISIILINFIKYVNYLFKLEKYHFK